MSNFSHEEIYNFCQEYLQVTYIDDLTLYAVCPFCHKEKKHWNINLDSGLWHCYRCKESGNFEWLVLRLRGRSFLKDYQSKFLEEISLPSLEEMLQQKEEKDKQIVDDLLENFPKIKDTSFWGKRITKYLHKRGISDEYFEELNLREGTGESFIGRVIIPIVENYEVKSFVARAVLHNPIRYVVPKSETLKVKHSSLLYKPKGIVLNDRFKNLCVCEGVFDAFAIQELAGFDAVAVLTNTISTEQVLKLVRITDRVTVVLDGGCVDESIKLAKNINLFIPVSIAELPIGKDPNELGSDVGKYIEDSVDVSNIL